MTLQSPQPSALPDGVRYYLLRDSFMVPLVPVDQLPFQLQGIPRHLTHRQMSDENWKLLQETRHSPMPLLIQAPGSILPSCRPLAPQPRFLAPDHHIRNERTSTIEETAQSKRWSMPPQTSGRMHVDPQISDKASSEHPSSLNDSLATVHAEDARRIGYSTTQPSSTEPDPAEKLLCRYWIRTGECDWGNNCKFKHEMPRTIHEMRKAGYLEYPKWWEEQKRIRTVPRGTTWIQDRVASRSQDAGSSRGAPEPRAFPNPSTFRTKQAEVRTVTHDGPSARSVPQQSVLSKQTKVLPISPLLAPIPEASIRRESHIENLLIDLDDTPTPQSSRVSSFNDEDYDDRTSSSRSSASSPASCVVIQPTLPITVATATEPKTATWEGKEKEQPYRHDVRRLSQSSWDSDSGMGETAIKPPGKRKTTHRKTTSRPNAPEKRHAGLSHPKNATAATNVNNNQANNAEAHGKNVSRKAPQHKGNEVGAMDLHTRIEQHRRNANQKVRTRKIGSGNVAAAPVVVEQISGV